MSISSEQILAVIGLATSLITGVFWGAYLLGKLVGRVDRVEQVLEDHGFFGRRSADRAKVEL